MRELSFLSELCTPLEYLLGSGNAPDDAVEKASEIELISAKIADQLRAQKLTSLQSNELEQQAYAVNSSIKDPELRNMNILAAV